MTFTYDLNPGLNPAVSKQECPTLLAIFKKYPNMKYAVKILDGWQLFMFYYDYAQYVWDHRFEESVDWQECEEDEKDWNIARSKVRIYNFDDYYDSYDYYW